MAHVTLITGGARSGKSTFGEELAAQRGGRVLYVATAKAIDEEMAERIRRHRQRRPATWGTLEAYRGLGAALPAAGAPYEVILIDCVTILCTNILFDLPFMQRETLTVEEMALAEDLLQEEIDALIAALPKLAAEVVFVTNEVGFGLVPADPLSRFYRDVLGRVNQQLAAAADEVYLVVAGLPLALKGGS